MSGDLPRSIHGKFRIFRRKMENFPNNNSSGIDILPELLTLLSVIVTDTKQERKGC